MNLMYVNTLVFKNSLFTFYYFFDIIVKIIQHGELMKKYLINDKGVFYKANLHTHTTLSDGVFSPEQIKQIYLDLGYSIVAYTDHDLFIPHNDLTDDKFLALNGYEWEIYEEPYTKGKRDTRSIHACVIARSPDMCTPIGCHREKYYIQNNYENRKLVKFDENEPDFERNYTTECINTFFKKAEDAGFFITYNHPTWNGETYEQYIEYENMHAFEIFNTGCYVGGYDEYNPRVFDDFLRSGKKIYCVATDDTHKQADVAGGWVNIKAEKLEYKTIMNALFDGQFYSSNGAEIKELYIEGDEVTIETSPAQSIVMNCGTRRLQCKKNTDGSPVTKATFKVFPYDKYIRFTVRGLNGEWANSNAYDVYELLK